MSAELQPIKRLGQVFLGKMVQPDPKAPTDVAAPYLRAAHVQPGGRIIDVDDKTMWFAGDELATHNLRRDDVVVVEGGAGFGRSSVLREDRVGWGFQNSIVRIRPHPQVSCGRFIDYALQSALGSGQIEVACFTATIPHFTADKVGAFPIPAPSVNEQQAIADYLDHETAQIDGLIAEQRRLIDLLAERRQAVLDAVTSEAADGPMRLKYLFTPSAEANFPQEEVLSVYRDYGVIAKSSRDDNFNRTPENLERYLLVRPGDLVVNRMKAWQGSLGISEHRGIVSGDYEVARPVSDRLLPQFAHLFLRSPKMIAEYAVRSTGIRPSQWRLYWDQMGSIEIPVPTMSDQRELVSRLDEQLGRLEQLASEAKRLIELATERRTALITVAVTGQIDVRGVA